MSQAGRHQGEVQAGTICTGVSVGLETHDIKGIKNTTREIKGIKNTGVRLYGKLIRRQRNQVTVDIYLFFPQGQQITQDSITDQGGDSSRN